ncbi:MAG: ABC transporter ATP-binding protein, partial [Clostridia bacterium]|nr:ABC transporter ATP-binding protein [Clostridia bacterium]
MKKSTSPKLSFSVLKRVFRYLRGYRVHLILSLLFAAISVALTLYVPILVGEAIDHAIEEGKVDFDAILPILWKIGIAVVITAVSQWIMNVLGNSMTYGIVARIRKDSFDHIQKLPLSYLDSHPTGE